MRNFKIFFVFLLAPIFVSSTVIVQRAQNVNGSNKSGNRKNSNAQKNGGAKDKPKNAQSAARSLAQPTPDKSGATKAQAVFDELKVTADTPERIEKLNKFIADFPNSELKIKAIEMLVISHVEFGETSFRNADAASGADHFRRAASAFETAVGDGIFNDVIAKLPFNLYFRNQQTAAFEVAREIEPKIKDNAPRLLALINFYLSTENADDAKRLATRAAEVAPESAAVQMSLGMAHRMAFHLEAASQSYARALELDPALAVAKRNLADAWRGLGQTEDALRLYREILAVNLTDEPARNGLVLTLLSTGNKDEAEKELAAALEQNPKNLVLQAGAAYWYAANGDGPKAIELAQKAVEIEPRYVWGQIALARGLILEKRPLEAERALLTAKQFGKFPTLDYELANARFAAGLYDEAVDDLRRSFTLKNGKLETKLAGRSASQAENFIELLSRERRASIFESKSAGNDLEARKLKELLTLVNEAQDNSDQNALVKAAQNFAADDDEMRVHREFYAANKLLNRKVALEQILEMTRNATGGLEKSLDVPTATAAILAEELYEPRRQAAINGSIVNIPVLPRETLRQIMRGRVEEIAGWTLYQQNKPDEAVVRLRRAVGVLPENSAWWRSSYWKLGSALEANGKSKEALEAYLKSYKADVPNETRLIIIQALYQRVYGSLDGLERKLIQTDGLNSAVAQKQTAGTRPGQPQNTPASFKNLLPNVIAELAPPKSTETPNVPDLKPEPTPEPAPASEIKSEMTADTKISVAAEMIPEIAPEESATALPITETKPEAAAPEAVASPAPELITQSTTKFRTLAISEVKPETETLQSSTPEAKAELRVAEKTEEIRKRDTKDKTEEITEAVAAPPVEFLAAENKDTNKTVDESALALETTVKSTVSDEESAPQNTDQTSASENVSSGRAEDSAKDLLEKDITESPLDRPRVVIVPVNDLPIAADEAPQKEPTKTPAACTMQINQSEVSILRNGGTIALLIKFSSAADAEKLNLSVSSPSDISVVFIPDDTNRDHRLIQVSSTSEITKIYTITLDSPCGKQEIKVKVR